MQHSQVCVRVCAFMHIPGLCYMYQEMELLTCDVQYTCALFCSNVLHSVKTVMHATHGA